MRAPTIPRNEGPSTWRRVWHHARYLARNVVCPATRLAVAVSDARWILARDCATDAGHAAAWLRIAQEWRLLGDYTSARGAVKRARRLRIGAAS